jgi:hypothetical protein
MNSRGTWAGVCAAAALLAGGCAGYRTVSEEDAAWPTGHPNVASVEESVTAALKWAVQRVPPPDHEGSGGQFAISPPHGLRQSRYLRMVDDLGPQAFPVSPETGHLPTYHVGSVLVRGGRATIDVFCPVLDRWGDIAYKPYTLNLEGGVMPWHVTSDIRAWQIGSMDPPAKYPLPAVDEPVMTEAGEGEG